jgi:hypothetical protein
MNEICIYPAFNARYYSPYIQGLRALVGSSRLRYTTEGFPTFGTDCLALRITGPDERKIYIHSNDMPELDEQGLAWCDVFGKVNLDQTLVPERYRSKVMAIGPTFAVRVWGPVVAEAMGIRNSLLSRGVVRNLRQHLANYRGQYLSRVAEDAYQASPSRPNYIFFNAALWEREPEANALRARFMDAIRSLPGISFEGGLSPRDSARGTDDFRAPGYESYLCRRYTPEEYLAKTRVSSVVLNNPAYRDCHSWRLGEYLALGKAIVSTPIVRAVPSPLVHGVHIHYVDGSVESLQAAVRKISGNGTYRRTLERNARAYYDEYLAPTSVVRRVLAEAGVALSTADRMEPTDSARRATAVSSGRADAAARVEAMSK